MAFFKKKSFRPPEVAETTIGLAGTDVMFLCQNLGYNEPEDTYQEAWSEYMKVQYALTQLVIANKRPDIIDQYSEWLKDSTIARIKAGVGTDILRDAVSKDSWFEDALHYQELPMTDIPNELYRKLTPLLPVSIGNEEEASIRRYLEERVPFIYESLMKLNFEV
jgi:hypothetical protein